MTQKEADAKYIAKHRDLYLARRRMRIYFKGKQIYLKHQPKTGRCSNCGKKKGDTFVNADGKLDVIKKTDMHHFEYHDDDPLKDAFELCSSCHGKCAVIPRVNSR